MERLLIILLGCLFCLSSCNSNEQADNSSKKYFDLKTYFENEALDLQKKNPVIEKTVIKDELSEKKNVTIRNWSNELELFSGSDINKPSWSTAYDIKNGENEIHYLAKDSVLKTRQIRISKSGNGKIRHILIVNRVRNNLYSSEEELHYFPDSLYSIRKNQKIRVIGNNDYRITGRIIQVGAPASWRVPQPIK